MEDEKELTTAEDPKNTSLKDVGRGLIFLAAIILLLTIFLFIMSIWENEYYWLFSGRAHLIFYTTLGLALLGIGVILVKSKSAKTEKT